MIVNLQLNILSAFCNGAVLKLYGECKVRMCFNFSGPGSAIVSNSSKI